MKKPQNFDGEQTRLEDNYTMTVCVNCKKPFRFRNNINVVEAIAFCGEKCRETYFQKNHRRSLSQIGLKKDGYNCQSLRITTRKGMA